MDCHHRIRAIDLRDLQAQVVQELAHRARVGLQGNARIVPQGLNEILAVDYRKLDVLHPQRSDFPANGLETLAQGPPIVGVQADVDHVHSFSQKELSAYP